MTELTGKVILDDETEVKLRAEIREDVINEIAKEGNYSNEIEIYLNKCDVGDYFHMIKSTIDDVITRTNIDELHFDQPKMLRKLKTIKEIISI